MFLILGRKKEAAEKTEENGEERQEKEQKGQEKGAQQVRERGGGMGREGRNCPPPP